MKKCDILLDVEILEEGYEGLLEDPIVVMGHGDPYTGPSHVTPTKETQVLNTIDFYMNDNITVEAIPSSYINTYDATLTSGDQMLQGITAYSDNIKYTGTIETKAGRDMTVDGFSVVVPSGYYAADVSKTFTVPQGSLQAGQISIDSSGLATYSATASGYFPTLESTSRNIQLATQSGITLIPGAASYIGVESGKYTTGEISVAAIRSDYVGGGVPRREASDLEISSNVITVPSGYYAVEASRIIPGGNDFAVTFKLDENDGLWKPDCTWAQMQAAVAAGKTIIAVPDYAYQTNVLVKGEYDNETSAYYYIVDWEDFQLIDSTATPVTLKGFYYFDSSGVTEDDVLTYIELPTSSKSITTNGTHDVTKYASANVNVQPSLQSKMNITPSESSQIISADNSYQGLSAVGINAISSTYIGTGVATIAATSYTPTTYNQTIAAGQYLIGTQTIAGDSNLIAENIKAGTSIFGVTGNYGGLGSNYTATIVNTSTYVRYSFIQYKDQTYKNLNDTFTFQAGDSLIIRADAMLGAGEIYINGTKVASSNDNGASYNYVLPSYNISIAISEQNSISRVYVSTPEIIISSNSRYDVSGYNYADVEVTYALQSFYEGIPIFTITSDIIDGVQSITCNKTYEECVYQMYQNDGTSNTTAIIDHHAVHNGRDYGHSYSGTVGFDEGELLQYGPAMSSYDSEGNFTGWLDIYWAYDSNIILVPSIFQQS